MVKSQMESEIQKSVKSSIKNPSTSLEEESGIQTDWEEKVKDYVDMVLNEKEKTKKV
jgi:fructose-1,6-bisphosphatase